MRTAEPRIQAEHVQHLSENLMAQLARGREWATPGVQSALQRAVAGLDTGIETASPRLQVLLRRLAEQLAGGVETLTPRVQERLKRVGPKTPAQSTEPVPVQSRRSAATMWWWVGALLALAANGVTVWRLLQASDEKPAPSLSAQETGPTDPDADADLTAGRM